MQTGVASATRSATYRADVVGSLLRPPWLIQARQELRAGTVGGQQIAFGLAILFVVTGYGRDARLGDRG